MVSALVLIRSCTTHEPLISLRVWGECSVKNGAAVGLPTGVRHAAWNFDRFEEQAVLASRPRNLRPLIATQWQAEPHLLCSWKGSSQRRLCGLLMLRRLACPVVEFAPLACS